MGTLIGVERQFRQRNAGLRTNILVSVGAAAFTVLSYAMTEEEGDPSRVAAQIVSGIGFPSSAAFIEAMATSSCFSSGSRVVRC